MINRLHMQGYYTARIQNLVLCPNLWQEKETKKSMCGISVINSRGELFFQHHLLRGGGVIQKGTYSGGGFILSMSSFPTFEGTESISNRCKTKLFGQRTIPRVHDELTGELFEGGSYFFWCWCREGKLFKGGVIQGNMVLVEQTKVKKKTPKKAGHMIDRVNTFLDKNHEEKPRNDIFLLGNLELDKLGVAIKLFLP